MQSFGLLKEEQKPGGPPPHMQSRRGSPGAAWGVLNRPASGCLHTHSSGKVPPQALRTGSMPPPTLACLQGPTPE